MAKKPTRSMKKIAGALDLLEKRVDAMTQAMSALTDRLNDQNTQHEDLYRWIRLLGNRSDRLQADVDRLKANEESYHPSFSKGGPARPSVPRRQGRKR